jgi:hypothetical protein
VAGLGWLWLYLTPPRLGFSDTDDPAVSLAFLRAHREIYAQDAAMLLLFAGLFLVAVLATHDRLVSRANPLATRWATAAGLVGVTCFFL